MKQAATSFSITVLVLISGYLILQNPHSSPAQSNNASSSDCCGPTQPLLPRELDFPYYSLQNGFGSTLNLVSDSPSPLDFTLSVHARSGFTVVAPKMTILPQAKLPIDMAALLKSLGADATGDFAEGSVSLNFVGTIMPLVGQMTITNPALGLVHEAEMVENDPGRTDIPAMLQGVWWNISGGRDAQVMVTNMSSLTASADVYLDYAGERHPSAVLTFNPHETKTVSIIQLLAALNASPSQVPEGGIMIIQRESQPTLIAQGKILDPATGFSTTISFPDPARERSNSLHASGVLQRAEIFAGGRHLATWTPASGGTTYFNHADWLGTERARTNSAGVQCETITSLPFGDGQTTTAQNGGCATADPSPNHFTGKERDTESGLDNFGARYNASTMGRFMTPDPLYLELHRLVDPQQLNLYSYGRNNPLAYADPTGLDVTCVGARCEDYLKALQKDVSFRIAYDKSGKVVTQGDIDKKGLSKADKALLKAIDDTKHHVTINAVGGEKDASVFFGASHGASHTINFDQAALLDSAKNAGGMTSAQLAGHETLEGYAESQGEDLADAHNYANWYFGGLNPLPSGATYGLLGGNVVQMTGNFAVHGSSTTERITMQFVTPIPQQDFLKGKGAPYAQYPTDVEAGKK